jgi:CRP-like cAMP-binding protein
MTGSTPNSTLLVKSKFLAGLDDTAIRHIQAAAQIRRVAPKKNVTIGGERPDHLFLLQTGRAKFYNLTESGSEVVLLWKVPGDIIGLVSLLANPPAYMASAKTVSECQFLVWDHSTILRLAKAYPQLTENGLRLALHYLNVYMNRHVSVITKTAELRLAEALIHLATEAGEVQPSGVEIDITNEQLSSLSDISPFTASRILSKWERDGKLSKQRGRVILRAPETLMIA